MSIKLDKLKKVEASSVPRSGAPEAHDKVELIIKVLEPYYVPRDVDLRARIDPHLFTCETRAESLPTLEEDPNVVSVAFSKPLHPVNSTPPRQAGK